MNDRRVIVVVGLSGVGKSTSLIRAQEMVDFTLLRASGLIQDERTRIQKTALGPDDLRNRDIAENQELMRSAFNRLAPASGLVVLDGHVIIDTPTGLVEVPPYLFKSLGVSKIIVLTETPEEILRRRNLDRTRTRPLRSLDDLRMQQERTVLAAHRVALELRVPLLILVCDQVDEIVCALQ
jgi:adenylate kinase